MADHRDHSMKPRRAATSPAVAAAGDRDGGDGPDLVTDEATGVHSGEALRMIRAARPTEVRLDKIERKQDEQAAKHEALSSTVTETRVLVGEIKGKLEVLPTLINEALEGVRQSQAREHVTFTAKVDVDRAEKVADIHDEADAKRQRRARFTKLFTTAITLIAGGNLMHWLIGKLG